MDKKKSTVTTGLIPLYPLGPTPMIVTGAPPTYTTEPSTSGSLPSAVQVRWLTTPTTGPPTTSSEVSNQRPSDGLKPSTAI